MTMPHKYSKRDRDAAAMYCALLASATEEQYPLTALTLSAIAKAGWRARKLASRAVSLVVAQSSWPLTSREVDAEAESLIRSGWSPGDR